MSNVTRTAYADPRTTCAADARSDTDNLRARLNWLVAFDAYETYRRRLFRYPREEQEMLLMRRPVATVKAYALFGLLLGLVPPAAIFYRAVGYPLMRMETVGVKERLTFFMFCLWMNFICSVVGWAMGRRLARSVDNLERKSWLTMPLLAALLGCLWALVTGAAGGLMVFGIGALFGMFCALPVGALGFALFTSLHRLLARGGMIDARHLWPLACGVTFFIAALILGIKQ
jgi:hypothetical protein